MPKHEKGTPKEIANRCKSKGLQKLRWYCEMCQKQCRDQNGFKCHLTSESHQRQLLLFAENESTYLREFSNDFKNQFLLLLKTAHNTKRVRANEVYQEYIRDKNHIHMNSTTWHTLTGFVQWLGKEGICHIDETEKGWYIAYIDKEAEMRKEELQRKAKAEKDDEERMKELIDARIQRAKDQLGEGEEYVPSELVRGEDDDKVTIQFGNMKPSAADLARPTAALLASSGSVFDRVKKEIKSEVKKEPRDDRDRKRSRSRSRDRKRERSRSRERARDHGDSKRSRDDRDRPGPSSSSRKKDEGKKKSALDEIREMEERKKEWKNRKDHWMTPGIVVKVVTKKLGAEMYKAKGVVKTMVDDYTANVKLDDVNGAYRGERCVLEAIVEKEFQVDVSIAEGLLKGRRVKVAYEDISKAA